MKKLSIADLQQQLWIEKKSIGSKISVLKTENNDEYETIIKDVIIFPWSNHGRTYWLLKNMENKPHYQSFELTIEYYKETIESLDLRLTYLIDDRDDKYKLNKLGIMLESHQFNYIKD